MMKMLFQRRTTASIVVLIIMTLLPPEMTKSSTMTLMTTTTTTTTGIYVSAFVPIVTTSFSTKAISTFTTYDNTQEQYHGYGIGRTQQRQRQRSRSRSRQEQRGHNMFTGIVEEMGTVVSMEERDDMTLWDGSKGKGTELVVKGDIVMDGAYLGCSICVNGVCLTATELNMDEKQFKVGLAPETLRRTYFTPTTLSPGTKVNLERASEMMIESTGDAATSSSSVGRNSGHFVQGHVDGTGTVIERYIDEDSLWYKIQVDDEFKNEILQYIVPKGFIAIDGTSLTVVDVNPAEGWFTFMLVGYTQKKIIIPGKMANGIDKVNIEVDVLGKYSQSAVAALLPRLEALEAKVESLQRQLSAEQNENTKK